jgi:predicted DCC family thiol-disulfide oxidoreductase YuxK
VKAQDKHKSDVPVVLLDGSCSHCHEWKETLQRHVPRGSVRYLAHRSAPLDGEGAGHEACKEPLAIIEPDGRTATGMEAIVRILRQSPVGKLAMVYYIPGVKKLADKWLAKRSQERCKFADETTPEPHAAPW